MHECEAARSVPVCLATLYTTMYSLALRHSEGKSLTINISQINCECPKTGLSLSLSLYYVVPNIQIYTYIYTFIIPFLMSHEQKRPSAKLAFADNFVRIHTLLILTIRIIMIIVRLSVYGRKSQLTAITLYHPLNIIFAIFAIHIHGHIAIQF